jgi:hypothetical protein
MTETDGSGDSVENRAIESFEALKGVSGAGFREKVNVAGGTLVAVRHKGDDGKDSFGWYFEKGEIKTNLRNTTEVARFIEGQIATNPFSEVVRRTPFPELAKIAVISVLALILLFAVIYIVINNPENKSLQVLAGLLGLTIGYFAGRVDSPNS